jgi:hypothetical protein
MYVCMCVCVCVGLYIIYIHMHAVSGARKEVVEDDPLLAEMKRKAKQRATAAACEADALSGASLRPHTPA